MAIIFDKKQGKHILFALMTALTLHFIITEGIFKHLLTSIFPETFRLRPWHIINSNIIPLGKIYLDSSFPSSHMASTLAVLTVLISNYKKLWPLALIFTILMAFSRIHNGMHFPTDVITGTMLGIGYGVLAIYFTPVILRIIHNDR